MVAVPFIAVTIGVIGVVAFVLNVRANTPPLDTLKPIRQGSNSVVFAADGSRLGYIQSDTIRNPVQSSDIPPDLKHGTVAIEDKNFYKHGGVDYGSIVRAAWADLKAGSPVQGGSTITQQLIRNLYIANPQETLERKIHEATWADQYEQEHSKNQILTKYLNTASYGTTDGRSALGVQAAAETYFGKPVSKLSLPEAAMIAGLPQAPSQYNPFLDQRAAKRRRNEVLTAMEQQGYISQDQYRRAVDSGIGLNRGYKYETIRQPYFFDYVQQQLIDKYGVNTVRMGGLKVYTTINPQLQQYAEDAVTNSCAVCAPGGGPAAALASVDPTNGHILAMASSQAYTPSSQFNYAADAHRQPGSSFKPYVLATALSQGMNPDTTYYSGKSPITLTLDDGSTWTVNNAEPGGGTMNVKQATIDSVNVIFAQLDLDVGSDNVAAMAHKVGITSHLDGFPAEGIGGLRIGVTPLEQADAYGTFADGGVHHPATAISKVVFRDGKMDVPDQGAATQPISDGIAYELTSILKGVITEGTGAGYTDFGCPAAGKTGTSEGLSDAWFVGYTPRLSTAVWVGHPNSRDYTGFGGPTAGPIWRAYMEAAHGSYCDDFPSPQNPIQYSSSWSGAHAVSSASSSSLGSSSSGTSGAYPYTPPSTSSTTSQYPQQYYAPGAGAPAAPSPPSSTGGGDTGTGGDTGGPPAGGPPAGGPPAGGPPGGGTGGGPP